MKTTEEIIDAYLKYADEDTIAEESELRALVPMTFVGGYRTAEAESQAEIEQILKSHDEEQERAIKSEASLLISNENGAYLAEKLDTALARVKELEEFIKVLYRDITFALANPPDSDTELLVNLCTKIEALKDTP
jgi:hypothetical protein